MQRTAGRENRLPRQLGTARAENSRQMRSTLYSASTRGDARPCENTAGCSPKAAPETARSRLQDSTGCLRARGRGPFPPGAVRPALHAPGKLSPRSRKGCRRLLQPTRGAASRDHAPSSGAAAARAGDGGRAPRKRRRPNGRHGGAAPRPRGTARGDSRPEGSARRRRPGAGGQRGSGARRSPSRPFSSRRARAALPLAPGPPSRR